MSMLMECSPRLFQIKTIQHSPAIVSYLSRVVFKIADVQIFFDDIKKLIDTIIKSNPGIDKNFRAGGVSNAYCNNIKALTWNPDL